MAESPEAVAFQLLELIMKNDAQEGELKARPATFVRNWVLHTYSECLMAARGHLPPSEKRGAGGPKGKAGSKAGATP